MGVGGGRPGLAALEKHQKIRAKCFPETSPLGGKNAFSCSGRDCSHTTGIPAGHRALDRSNSSIAELPGEWVCSFPTAAPPSNSPPPPPPDAQSRI